MTQPSPFINTLLSVVFSLAIGMSHLQAETTADTAWQPAVEARLKAIYDRKEFRHQKFQAEWLPDSSGYTVQERDPQSDAMVKVTYLVRMGERVKPVSDEKNPDEKKPEEKKPDAKKPLQRGQIFSPDGSKVLESEGRNLFVSELVSGKRVQLTQNTAERDLAYYEKMWSPDGKKILFVETDFTNVRQRAVLGTNDPSYPDVQQHRFARVGEVIEKLRVGIVDSGGENLTWLPMESPEEGIYFGQVEWAGNSDEVIVEKFSRFRNQRDFYLVKTSDKGAAKAEVKSILHEVNDAWVDSSQEKNSGLMWTRGGKAFVLVSEKDGWRHAYLWSREGKELALLTPGKYDIIDRAAIDEGGGWYYFYASPDNATQKHLFRVPLDGSGTLERISPSNQPGTHLYQFSPDAKLAIHTYSTLDSPPIVELVELAGHRVIRVLNDNEKIREKMKSVISHPTEFLQLTIGNGVSMDAWMIKPKDFDPLKKYPVFIYVYGEPHAQTVLNEWGTSQIDFHRVVADLGYLVLTIDNRGTPAPKGAAWRRAVFGSLGPLSTEEQEAGLKELARTRPYVDLTRVGIWGWSGGGSNTLNAMFRKPDSYHVGIAVVPKPQPHLYNAGFQENYMRTREVNPEGYKQAAAINFADGLKGKLLIITGSGETNAHIQIIEGLVDRLIKLGKPFDYMVYPNRDHSLLEGEGTLVHVRMYIIRYLLSNLPAGAR